MFVPLGLPLNVQGLNQQGFGLIELIIVGVGCLGAVALVVVVAVIAAKNQGGK